MIEPEHPRLSVVRQCELISISRSGFYYRPAGETPLNLTLMRLIDEQFLETPWYGSRQMARHLRREGYRVGRKRVRRLMAKMGLEPIYQRPRTTVPHPTSDLPVFAAGDGDRPAEPGLVCRHQCAAASGVRDGGRPPAIGLQEQAANHRARTGDAVRWPASRLSRCA
jgi:HTH-like domain